jgi:pyridinium-3,5-biscarboxylic acid mononucleotide sulfurtransferase
MSIPNIERKLCSLREILRTHAPLVIAYSGGTDSAFLLAVAAQTTGPACFGAIADSPSLPRRALLDALALARGIGAQVEVVQTAEMNDPNYTSNPVNRCYFCKAELFRRLDNLARERGFRAIAYGENADDAHQARAGRKAAAEFSVLAPLKEVGLTKSEIRHLSRAMQLPTADAPAQPCLSSRIPHGTAVTGAALAMIEQAELIVRGLGFRVFRVRHHLQGDRPHARVEIAPEEMPRLDGLVEPLRSALGELGYEDVLIDARGYRSPIAEVTL